MTAQMDLELKALDSFCGTQEYHKVLGFNVTDGVTYIMQNGYSYLLWILVVLALIGIGFLLLLIYGWLKG